MRVAGLGIDRSEEGRELMISDAAGVRVVTLRFDVPGEQVAGWASDDEELVLAEGAGVRSRLRAAYSAGDIGLELTVDNLAGEWVELPPLGLEVACAPGATGWWWSCGADAIVAAASADDARGGVLLRLRNGFLWPAGRPLWDGGPAFAGASGRTPGRAGFVLARPGAEVGPFRRYAVGLELAPLAALEDAAAALPAWLPPTVVRADTDVALTLPDLAIDPGPGLRAWRVDEDYVLELAGDPGRRQVGLLGREVRRLELAWYPTPDELLPQVAARLVWAGPGAAASEAAGFVVAEAVARSLASDAEGALDWLEGVDWASRGGLLGVATAAVLAGLVGDRALLAGAWAALRDRPVEPGYGLTVMRVWLAALAATGEPPAVARELLGRPGVDAASQLELALLGYRSQDVLEPGIAGLIHQVGGSLPGRSFGMDAARAARTCALLRLCPESWARFPAAAEAAGKVEGLLLADVATSLGARGVVPADELDGLAWLLLGELGI